MMRGFKVSAKTTTIVEGLTIMYCHNTVLICGEKLMAWHTITKGDKIL